MAKERVYWGTMTATTKFVCRCSSYALVGWTGTLIHYSFMGEFSLPVALLFSVPITLMATALIGAVSHDILDNFKTVRWSLSPMRVVDWARDFIRERRIHEKALEAALVASERVIVRVEKEVQTFRCRFGEEYDRFCKYCGAGPHKWHLAGDKWRLEAKDGTFHDCFEEEKKERFYIEKGKHYHVVDKSGNWGVMSGPKFVDKGWVAVHEARKATSKPTSTMKRYARAGDNPADGPNQDVTDYKEKIGWLVRNFEKKEIKDDQQGQKQLKNFVIDSRNHIEEIKRAMENAKTDNEIKALESVLSWGADQIASILSGKIQEDYEEVVQILKKQNRSI